MGSYTHDCVLAIGFGDEWVASVEEFRMGLPAEYIRILSNPIVGMNGQVSYLFGPDGGKDGGERSQQMDKRRELFIALVEEQGKGFAQYIHLRFGETVEGVEISSTNV